MTAPAFGGRVLDSTAILDLASGATLYARALVAAAVSDGFTLVVPAGALAAAWARTTPAGRLFVDDLLELAVTIVDPLDALTARATGAVLSGGSNSLDVGHVVVSARARGWPVITAEPGPLLAVAPDVDIERLP